MGSFNFGKYKDVDEEDLLTYGDVPDGQYLAKVRGGAFGSYERNGRNWEYLKLEFVVELEGEKVLVSGFFNLDEKRPDPRFVKFVKAIGIYEDFGDDRDAMIKGIAGAELEIQVGRNNNRGYCQAEDYKKVEDVPF